MAKNRFVELKISMDFKQLVRHQLRTSAVILLIATALVLSGVPLALGALIIGLALTLASLFFYRELAAVLLGLPSSRAMMYLSGSVKLFLLIVATIMLYRQSALGTVFSFLLGALSFIPSALIGLGKIRSIP